MKVFYITSRFPYPIEKGDKLRAYYHIKELSQEFEVHLYATTMDPVSSDHIDHMKQYCKDINIFKSRGIKGLFFPVSLIRWIPFQTKYFYSRELQEALVNDIKSKKPDHIHFHLIRCGEYIRQLHKQASLDFMDAFSKSLKGLSHKVSFIKRPIYRLEAWLVCKYENALCRGYGHCFAISSRDIQHLDPGREHGIEVLKNGIDLKFFTPLTVKKSYDIAFVGNLGYEPNYQAVQFINELAKRMPNRRFLIAGARSERLKKASMPANVHVEGWYDDIRAAYCSAHLFIAPIFYGTGMQNKILESMALGIPCITTSFVNETIGGTDQKNIFIANSEKEFELAITHLFNNHGQKEMMGVLARGYVEENYSWKQHTLPLKNYIKRVSKKMTI